MWKKWNLDVNLVSLLGLIGLVISSFVHAADSVQSVYDDGFWWIGADDKLRVGGQAQIDTRVSTSGSPEISTFQIRRARIYGTGVLDEKWGYMVMGKWDRGTVGLHFAWIESQHTPFARIRFGQFKEPYSLEAVNSDQYFDFDERSLWMANLSQAEDLGAMLYGKFLENHVEYGLGVFNGRGKEKDDTNEAKEVVGQITFLPLQKSESDWFKGLLISFSGAITKLEDDLKSSSYTTAAQTKFWTYSSGVTPLGNKTRASAELEWNIGSGSLKGGAHQARFDTLQNAAVQDNITISGWSVSGSYILTGEKKPRNRPVIPEKSFDPDRGGWGAWELAARYEQLIGDRKALDDGIMSGAPRTSSYTLGLNCYLNRHMRSMFDFQNTSFSDPVLVHGTPILDESTFKFRIQFEF